VLVLMVVAAGLLWLTVATHATRLGFSDLTRRASFVIAYLLFQVVTVAIIELGSLGNHLDETTVTVAWVVVVLVEIGLCWRTVAGVVRRTRGRHAAGRVRPGVDQLVVGAVLAAFFAALLVMGFLYRPTNTDSAVYHLARVEHWAQAGSVGPFAAHYLALVELAPLSAYHFLTLRLVTGTDRWDGYVELGAAVVCVLGVSELARRMGLSGRGQAFTALLAATLPNLLLEATSTTNNLFGASIGVGALVVLTSGLGAGGWISRGLALGAVLGLAELAKGTLVVMVGPAAVVLVVVAVARLWREQGHRVVLRQSAGAVLAGAAAAAAVAGPFLGRNLALFGGLGGPVTRSTVVADPSPAGAAGNVIRSVSAQFLVGGEHGPLHVFSSAVTGVLERLYDAVGPADSSDYVFEPDVLPFNRDADWSITSRFEDVGANPWHVLLLLFALITLTVCVLIGRKSARLPLALALALCVGFLGFAISGRWSIYATRYYLPLLVLWCPLIAVAFGQLGTRLPARIATRVVAALLVAAALPVLLDNYTRPLVHTEWRTGTPLEDYFARAGADDGDDARALAKSYSDLTAAIADSSCDEVGLATRVFIEYPLWVGLQQQGWDGTIHDVIVSNVTKKYEPRNFEPCAVIVDTSTLVPGVDPPPDSFPGLSPTQYGPLTLYLAPAT
jgi:hypothetical protein